MSTFLDNLSRYKYNPGALQRAILENLESVSDGAITVVDPSTPFNALLESSCFNSAMVMQEMVSLWRKQYKSLAASSEDLYYHLSDQDFVGLFATASQGQFILAMDLDELKQHVVQEDNTRIKKLVIPRHSVFEVAGYSFTLQYPIEIRLMPHGGLQVVYDNELPSPLQTLSSNQLEWDIIRLPNQTSSFLQITLPLQQITITPHYWDISASMGLIKEVVYSNQFSYARAWISTTAGGWEEIDITHQDIVHNLSRPTVTLRVADGNIRAELPPVYVTDDLAGRQLRLDVYTTLGELNLDLSGYKLDQYSAEWRDLNGQDDYRFSAPLDRFNNYLIYGLGVVDGGSEALSFDELRERVLYNAQGNPSLPITQHQMSTMVSLRGYSLVKYVDNITDRIYHVAKALPAPTTGELSTGANATVRNVEIDLDVVRHHPQVWDNGDSITLVPDILYEDEGSDISLLYPTDVEAIKSGLNEVIANEVNTRNFLYTPFYYVIDQVDGHHSARAYHLDGPTIPSKSFVMENETSELQLTTGSFYITKTENGYRVTVITSSGDATKALDDDDLVVQLSFIPDGETNRAYVNGVLRETIDGERVYDFDLISPHQIDRSHRLLVTNFLMFDEAFRELPCPLEHTFDVMYYVRDHSVPGLTQTDIDNQLASWLVDTDNHNYVGVAWESLSVSLGVAMERLWCKTRVVPGTLTYATWETDEPKLYTADVWETDTDGHLLLTDDGAGGVTGNLLHAAGDPVLDETGEPEYLHRVGDLMVVDGEPVLIKDRGLKHYVDLYLVEGTLEFVTDTTIQEYRDTIPDRVAQWLQEDLSEFSERLLERTELYLHPQNQLGLVDVIVDENSQTAITAEQDFLVTYHLTSQQYTNVDLRQALTDTARSTIQSHLSRTTVSISEIVQSLRAAVEDSVLDVSVEGLGGASNYQAVTMVSTTDRLSIRKRLVNLANEVLTLTDDVQVKFIRHLEI